MAVPDLKWAHARRTNHLLSNSLASGRRPQLEAVLALSSELDNRVKQFEAAAHERSLHEEDRPITGMCSQEAELAELHRLAAFHLSDVVRSILDAVAAASGVLGAPHSDPISDTCANTATMPSEVLSAFARVRQLLHLRPIVRAVREFVAICFYLVLTCPPREDDVHTWTARSRLVAFIKTLCGLVDNTCEDSNAGSGNWQDRPCPMCTCHHIAIQEGLSLLQYIQCHFTLSHRASVSRSALGSIGESDIGNRAARPPATPQHGALFNSVEGFTPFMEEGVSSVFHALTDLMSGLHPGCYATAHRIKRRVTDTASGTLAWKGLLLEIASNGKNPSDWSPLLAAPLLASQVNSMQKIYLELANSCFASSTIPLDQSKIGIAKEMATQPAICKPREILGLPFGSAFAVFPPCLVVDPEETAD